MGRKHPLLSGAMASRRSAFKSGISVRGDISLTVRDAATGRVIRRITKKNTITYAGLGSFVRLWSQRVADPAPSTFAITTLHASTGNTAPGATDTNLATPGGAVVLTIVDGDKTETLAPPLLELKVLISMDAATGNDKTFKEVGAFMQNGTMAARQIHPSIEKTNAITIEYDWRWTFVAS